MRRGLRVSRVGQRGRCLRWKMINATSSPARIPKLASSMEGVSEIMLRRLSCKMVGLVNRKPTLAARIPARKPKRSPFSMTSPLVPRWMANLPVSDNPSQILRINNNPAAWRATGPRSITGNIAHSPCPVVRTSSSHARSSPAFMPAPITTF